MRFSAKKRVAPVSAHKTISILGSTGTIGCNTLRMVEAHPDRFTIDTLTGGNNIQALIEQALTFTPKHVVIANDDHYGALKDALSGSGITVAAGDKAVCDAAARPADLVMSAIVGAAGLKPTLTAMRSGTQVALANKECLVCAGELMMKEAQNHHATLIPVDSEHSAIFQVYDAREAEHVSQITITASGGPFRTWDKNAMRHATPEEAVKHPNWKMGAKISVDSATMMNKGLELIEAYYLFPMSVDQLSVVVHPQSIVHCLVRMVDGSVLAQMSPPDMRTPIAYAMAWPQRISTPMPPLDLAKLGQLTFEAVDHDRFPAVELALYALREGGNAPTILNAANEVAVNRFLRGEIGFLDIVAHVEQTLARAPQTAIASLEDVMECDAHARKITETL